ncbi:MAG: hypothetical protein RL456_2032 [Pseudomonadota bacterium]|jgi:competence protein ComEA
MGPIRKLLLGLAIGLLATAAAQAATDINKASQAELEAVKGIGPSMSSRILDERRKSPFKDWADVMDRVKGVRQATATRLSTAGLTVNGGSFEQAVAPAAAGRVSPAEGAAPGDPKGERRR